MVLAPLSAPRVPHFSRTLREVGFPLGPYRFSAAAFGVCVQGRVMRYRGREAAPRKRFEIDDGFSRWGTLRVTSKRFFSQSTKIAGTAFPEIILGKL
jgi:hypothetical protein